MKGCLYSHTQTNKQTNKQPNTHTHTKKAGPVATDALLVVGSDDGHYAGDPSKPVVLSDVFARVGGPDTYPVQADAMVVVNAGNVLGDNLWLWRADHTVSGLVYNGVSLIV